MQFFTTVDEIKAAAQSIMDEGKKVYDSIAALQAGEHTFANTIQALALLNGRMYGDCSLVTFPQYTSTDSELRDASAAATQELEEFDIECDTREDVYLSLCAFRDSDEAKTLNVVDQRLLKKTLLDFERKGLGLSADKREELKKIMKEMSALAIEFQKHLNEETTKLNFTDEELAGLPESFINNLQKNDDGKRIVSLKYPELFPVLKWASNPATRRAMDEANARKCNDTNVTIIEKLINLRRQKAQLLGYANFAEFILEERMAKSSANVQTFLNELHAKLIPGAEKELANLRELKKEMEGSLEGYEDKILSHDFHFYHTLNVKRNYNVDENAIKDYFPLHRVTDGMLKVYEELLSLRFEKQTDADTWHPDVQTFNVKDATSGDVIGTFYLDLFPRDGKYGHAAVFPMMKRYKDADGVVHLPRAAMVANFTKPTDSEPSLLKHSEVVTYFHEFGHVMHNICSTANYARFSGTSVERDFVEAPSQMLENWCYESEVLHRLSGHFEREDEKLPEDMLKSLVDAKNADTGLLNCRQLFFGLFDNTVHAIEADETFSDSESLYRSMRKKISLVENPADSNPLASFGHLAGGYEAQYYGYLYSEVFSADMFDVFKQAGVLNPELGRKYRDVILGPGGSVDSIDSLRDFLGRDPTQDAFLKHIGLQ